MPSRPSAPSSFHRCFGNSLERSISAARGAIFSCAKRRTMSRSASMSSPCAKLSVCVYIFLSLQTGLVVIGSDQAERHGEIGLSHLLDAEPLVRAEPDDDA